MSKLEETVIELRKKLKQTDAEIAALHECFERKGVNSRGTADLFGRPFSVPVDAEHKATVMPILNFSNPHMRAFHASYSRLAWSRTSRAPPWASSLAWSARAATSAP